MAIDLPDFDRAFEYENDFYLSCHPGRLSKLLAHYELYRLALDRPGAVVECGVFKGASLVRWAKFRALLSNGHAQKIIGFDTFDEFPETGFEQDAELRRRFIQAAGSRSISTDQLRTVLDRHGLNQNIDLVAGDIARTVPGYLESNPQLKISLLVVDVDLYEATWAALDGLYDRVVPGGVVVLDDYGAFAGANAAIDRFLEDRGVDLRKFPFASTPAYFIKGRL
ncbi:MAG: TylF/MycF family methyltransferase [Proteobacteria bacterium]|nr:TylF/MycF family methyltransferase [Pseudomonadota bacterium]